MKICWDNIEKLKFTRNGNFTDGHTYYEYESCGTCRESYLGRKNAKYCDHECGYHLHKDKIVSIESRLKISESHKGKKDSEETRRKKSMSHKIKNKDNYAFNNIPIYDRFVHQLEPYEKCRRNIDDPNILEVLCVYCDKWYVPTLNDAINRIYGINNNDTCRFYCCDECKQVCPMFRQQKYPKGNKPYNESRPHQHELKVRTFDKDEGICQICGIEVTLETSICHHEVPVAIN